MSTSYTIDVRGALDLGADCIPAQYGNQIYLVSNTAYVYLLLSDSQLEQLHAAIQQRVTQIAARRMNEAQVAEKEVA